MTKRLTAVLLAFALLLSIMLLAGIASAEEGTNDFLGKSFPDFTVTDTEGNTFTLSEALKDHEAVLINFWATWCGPCRNEFPHLNEAYEKYRDKVAFIALSKEENDTIGDIAEYRKENGISLPMGRDEELTLYNYLGGLESVPKTVVVDRFGNAVFYHDRAFSGSGEVERVLDTFLGDSYTQTAVLESIPRDDSTQAFPVAPARALYPVGDCKKACIYAENLEEPIICWVIPGESVIMRMEVAADDDVPAMMYADTYLRGNLHVTDLLDPETGVYSYEQFMPQPEDQLPIFQVGLFNGNEEEITEKDIVYYMVKDEECVEILADSLKADGFEGVHWEYAEADDPAKNALQAYFIHVVDQDNNPVGEVTVNFCTDTACTPQETDETGTISYEGEPYKYHVQIIEVPEGYSYDETFDMYTTPEYGEWTLRIRKD